VQNLIGMIHHTSKGVAHVTV